MLVSTMRGYFEKVIFCLAKSISFEKIYKVMANKGITGGKFKMQH